jgi:hypothetical protein
MSLVEGFKRFLLERAPIRVAPHRVVESLERLPMFSVGIENIYGVPVYDILDQYKGQVIGVEWVANYTDFRHRLPTMAVKLRLGSTMLFARARHRGKEGGEVNYPIVVNGVATPYIDILKRPDYRFAFYEFRMETGEFVVAFDDILNIEQVMNGTSPILVTDKYGVRYIEKVKEADRLLELSKLVEQLTIEAQRSQVRAEEERRNANMAMSMADYYRRSLHDAYDRIEKLSKEYYNVREEFTRALSTLREKVSQLEIVSESSVRVKSLVEGILEQMDSLARSMDAFARGVKEALTTLGVAMEKGAEVEAGGGGGEAA